MNFREMNSKQIVLGVMILIIAILLVLSSFVFYFVDALNYHEPFIEQFTLKILGWKNYLYPIMFYAWFFGIIAFLVSVVCYIIGKYKYLEIGLIATGALISITVAANMLHFIRETDRQTELTGGMVTEGPLFYLGFGYWVMAFTGLLAIVVGVTALITCEEN